jgi:ABC-type oligopeptide transport system substrate-binding subunit
MRALVLLFVAACSRGDPRFFGRVVPAHPPDEVWTNNGSEPEWIDPGKCSDSAGGTVVSNLFAGLVEPDPVTLEPIPDIARSWEISDDGRRYTFFLRESGWSDGTAVTAHDFVYSWRRVVDPKTASKYATYLYTLKYGQEVNTRAVLVPGVVPDIVPIRSQRPAPELGGTLVIVDGDEAADLQMRRDKLVQATGGRVVDPSILGVRALDDLTLEVELENPIPYFLQSLSFYTTLPVPRHVVERLGGSDLWTRPEHIVTNGAYTLEEWRFRQHMWFRKNPHYWDARAKVPRIRMAMVESYNTSLNLYEAGEFDYSGENLSLPSEFMDHLSQFQDFFRDPYLGIYFYWINTHQPPMDDPRVRQALSLAIDRQALVTHVARAGQIPTSDMVPDGLAGYRALKSPIYDPDRARRLLAEAGYPAGRGFPKTSVIYNTSEAHKQLAEAAQQMWKETLGVEIQIDNQEWKVYLKNLEMMNFQVARMGWIGDYPDPYTFLELFTRDNGNNHSGWSNAEYERLLQQANAMRDKEGRLDLLRQAEAILHAATPVIPFYVYTRSEMRKPYLMGHWGNFQNEHRFKYWWIDERWVDGPQATLLPNPPPAHP